MRFWPVLLLAIPTLAWGQDEASAPPVETPVAETKGEDHHEVDSIGDWEAAAPHDDEQPITWLDKSHATVTNQTQTLTKWMDAFFGDPDYNLEQAESYLRLELINEWDEEDGNDEKVRLRGKVHLPKISRRLKLVFQDEEGEALTNDELREGDNISLQYEMREGRNSRFDATLSWSSGNPKPGLRYRLGGDINEQYSYRYIQRLQYEDGEGFYTRAKVDLNHSLDEDNVIRWSNSGKWGEETNGVEWKTSLGLRQRKNREAHHPLAVNYYASISGDTRPDHLTTNYKLGTTWRRQLYRDYLFFEVEPAFNYRRRTIEDDREPAWSIDLRLEIALERDLMRTGRN